MEAPMHLNKYPQTPYYGAAPREAPHRAPCKAPGDVLCSVHYCNGFQHTKTKQNTKAANQEATPRTAVKTVAKAPEY